MTRRSAIQHVAWVLHLLAAVLWVTGCSGRVDAGEDGPTASASQAVAAAPAANSHVTWPILTALRVLPPQRTITNGRSTRFRAEGTFSDGKHQDVTAQVRWSVTSGTATISNAPDTAGTATSEGAGVSTIEASDAASGLSATATLNVTAARLRSIVVTPAVASVPLGLTQQLAATGVYSDGTTQDLTTEVTWSSSSTDVLVLGGGLVVAVSLGCATITATDPATGVAGTARITATAAVLESLRVVPFNAVVAAGSAQGFTAVGTFSDGSQQDLTASVTWSSSDTSIALVSNAAGSAGLATAIAGGTATITATDPATGTTGAASLIVIRPTLLSVRVSPIVSINPAGATQQFTAVGSFSDGTSLDITSTVTWSSSADQTVAVSNAAGSEGLATAIAPGSATITATDPSTGLSSSATFLVVP